MTIKKVIKPFIVSFTFLVLVMLGIAWTMPKDYSVEKSLEIKSSPASIFPAVADFSRWKEWTPWFEREPTALYEYRGIMGEVGSSIQWKGKIVGRGNIELEQVVLNKKLSMILQFETPHKTQAKGNLSFQARGSSTVVTWSNQGELEYPMGRLFGPFLKEMIGNDIQLGLENLKKHIENQSNPTPSN